VEKGTKKKKLAKKREKDNHFPLLFHSPNKFITENSLLIKKTCSDTVEKKIITENGRDKFINSPFTT